MDDCLEYIDKRIDSLVKTTRQRRTKTTTTTHYTGNYFTYSHINEHPTMNTNKVLIWLKDFKYTWLPHHISNNNYLFGLISTKLHELERILDQDNQNEISIVAEHQYDTEPIVLSREQRSLPTPPEIHHQIDDEKEKLYRPAIRLKRISLAEAENFLPAAWKPTKLKRGGKKSKKRSSTNFPNPKKYKKNTQTNKFLSSTTIQDETATKSNGIRKSPRPKKPTHPPATTPVISTQLPPNNQKKNKRKLRAIDAEDDDLFILGSLSQSEYSTGHIDCEQIPRYIGQNGLLSQTRRTNETTYDDDFTIKLHSRQSNQNKTKISNHSNGIDLDTIIIESPEMEAIPIDDDVALIDEEQVLQDVLESNDNESLFASLDKTLDTSSNTNSILNYNDCIEDITNDGIDPPPSSSSPYLSLTT